MSRFSTHSYRERFKLSDALSLKTVDIILEESESPGRSTQ